MVSDQLVSVEDIFIGRQPILDRNQSLYAYELLFRSANEDSAKIVDGISATSSVITQMLSESGIDAILGKFGGFINCDAAFLQSEIVELLPRDKIVLEILETVIADEATLRRCIELKRKGYRLALDDFQGFTLRNKAFLNLVDIIKVDIKGLSSEKIKEIVKEVGNKKVQLLAEKVETKEEFSFCHKLGFSLYQGYFFADVEKIAGKRFSATQSTIIQLLHLLQSDSDVNKIVDAFKKNPILSVGLLRLTNSASVGLRHVVTSIRSAVVLLGQKQLQRWLLLLLMTHGSPRGGKQTVLVQQAACRGKFMELMALSEKAWEPFSESAFITGIVSMMEALLGIETKSFIDSLNLSSEVRDALLDKKGVLGELLQLVEAIEKDEVAKVAYFVETKVKGGYETLAQAQRQTILWVNHVNNNI